MSPELDIVVYAVNAPTTKTSSERARNLFERAASQGLHLALIELPLSLAEHWLPDMDADSETITDLQHGRAVDSVAVEESPIAAVVADDCAH